MVYQNTKITGEILINISHTHSLSNTKWNCKYHAVFALKYRRKVFYGSKRLEIGAILMELCNCKEVNIIEVEVCPDYVYMLPEIPPKLSVSSFMVFLKGKSSIKIYEKWESLKYKYGNSNSGGDDIMKIQ